MMRLDVNMASHRLNGPLPNFISLYLRVAPIWQSDLLWDAWTGWRV
jgi:hypothetical protein